MLGNQILENVWDKIYLISIIIILYKIILFHNIINNNFIYKLAFSNQYYQNKNISDSFSEIKTSLIKKKFLLKETYLKITIKKERKKSILNIYELSLMNKFPRFANFIGLKFGGIGCAVNCSNLGGFNDPSSAKVIKTTAPLFPILPI